MLGDAGHGKTINLLRLGRRLADRAVDEHGVATTVPVIFTLSAWTTNDTDLVAWMTRELGAKYLVPKRDAALLLAESSIVPLLDGLDDVAPAARARCVAAINDYRRANPRNGIVVTCRTHDYAALAAPLSMALAVVLRELTEREIGRQLRVASQLELLRALDDSHVLQELSRTPILLHVMQTSRLPVHDQGWVYSDELCTLADYESISRLNVEVHRARADFARQGIPGAPSIVQRRRGSGQVRLGTDRVDVVRGRSIPSTTRF